MIVQDREPWRRRCRPAWAAASASIAAAVVLAAATFSPAPAAQAPAPAQAAVEEATYRGKVTEFRTGRPIAGATVVVRLGALGPENKKHVERESRTATAADGSYAFTAPPEMAADPKHYLELNVTSPGYAGRTLGSTFATLRRREADGGSPFFGAVALRPVEAISGKVERPDGSPAAGVLIVASSQSSTTQPGPDDGDGSRVVTRTDAAGDFRVDVITPGIGVFWIIPDDLAPRYCQVPDPKRGDLGVFRLSPGVAVRGKMLDEAGRPVARVYVNAVQVVPRGQQRIGLGYDSTIVRSALTADDGSFALAPLSALSPQSCTVAPSARPQDYEARFDGSGRTQERPLPGVYRSIRVDLKEGQTPAPVEFRALPRATVELRWVDSHGRPVPGRRAQAAGLFTEREGWLDLASPDPTGATVVAFPRGIKNAQIGFQMDDDHAIRWRIGRDGPLRHLRFLALGTLDADLKDVEVVRYDSPSLTATVKTADGKPTPDLNIGINYSRNETPPDRPIVPFRVGAPDVRFEGLPDGRFRSENLLPDEEFTVTAQADGYRPATRTMSLPEGKAEAITLTLEPK